VIAPPAERSASDATMRSESCSGVTGQGYRRVADALDHRHSLAQRRDWQAVWRSSW
jgi:hypothetical protein